MCSQMSPKLSVAVICLRVAGKLFHRRGPATVKLLSPKVVRVRVTVSDRYDDERRWFFSRPCSEARWMSADALRNKRLLGRRHTEIKSARCRYRWVATLVFCLLTKFHENPRTTFSISLLTNKRGWNKCISEGLIHVATMSTWYHGTLGSKFTKFGK